MQASSARVFLRRLRPWLGKAVHRRWSVRRSVFQSDLEALLAELAGLQGRLPPELALRLEGFLGCLYREWFPRQWRPHPSFAEIVADFRWWLSLAESWDSSRARPRVRRAARGRPAGQPARLLRILRLPEACTQAEFLRAWRRFLKANHPDLHPEQSPEERRLFAEAVALRRRS